MTDFYYSPSTGGFYNEEIHGSFTVQIPDPKWVKPKDSPTASAPLIEVANPNLKIPSDAIKITQNKYISLMQAQAEGKEIQSGDDGKPVAVKPVPPPPNPNVSTLDFINGLDDATRLKLVNAAMTVPSVKLWYDTAMLTGTVNATATETADILASLDVTQPLPSELFIRDQDTGTPYRVFVQDGEFKNEVVGNGT